ncbi:hypothetical protein [Amycolatopsis tucumanensis]|nr:hypothetical protein [Amycolatopsis tucumanensis]MCF6423788.1 hypothetical protein [Amycolatopsis tucumanensis]
MPLAVRRAADGWLVWSGFDVVFGEVTRTNPNFGLFANPSSRECCCTTASCAG